MRSMMNAARSALVAAGVAAGVIGGVGVPPSAWAYDASVNGTYTATLVGQWAQWNDVYHQQPMMRNTWKISTSCDTAYDCTGQVISDGGWTARVYMRDGSNWTMKRDIPNWARCPDGRTFTGQQVIVFYAVDPMTGEHKLGLPNSPIYSGWDNTTSSSGACNTNLPIVIRQPFRLDRIG